MDDPMTSSGDQERTQSLHTYLHDHAAGARYAVQLLTALRDHHAGTSIGDFAADQLQQIQEDLKTLESLAEHIGAGGFQTKELAGWLAEKFSGLKLSPIEKPFHTFEALESLSLGILGKRALWTALASVARSNPGLNALDFDSLLQRAEVQHAATESVRLQLAAQVFG